MKSDTSTFDIFRNALYDSLRHTADMLVDAIGEDIGKFDIVYRISFTDPYPMNMRAARVCQLCCMRKTELIFPYLDELPDRIEQSNTVGVKRSFLKIYSDHLHEKQFRNIDKLSQLVFEWVIDMKQPLAIRAYSLNIIYKITKLEPGLRNELLEIIRVELESPHPAMQARAKILSGKLNRLQSCGGYF